MVDPLFPAVKFATPLLEVALVAIKLEISVAFAVAPEETIKTSPVVKSVIKSVPEVTLKVSFPVFPVRVSAPPAPSRISSLALPRRVSSSVSPVKTSTPTPPKRLYAPFEEFVTVIVDPLLPALKFATPLFEVALVAIKLDIFVAFAVPATDTINISPVVKSVIISFPDVTLNVS